jgi:S-adenosylmethionine:tRNA ribosyltransferase-isomerase
LHFSQDILQQLTDKKVKIANITLHVGLGTFRPVKVDDVLDHKMHSEYYELSQENANIINMAKINNKHIFAVGTTSCRTLESVSNEEGVVVAGTGFTDIFIYPGYKFKVVDGLITNFHLPKSTLIMLVSAFYNKEEILSAYNTAVNEKYKFFSFGDAMLIKG